MSENTDQRKPHPLSLGPKQRRWVPLTVMLLIGLAVVVGGQVFSSGQAREIPYSEFKEYLAAGQVAECRVGSTLIEGQVDARRTADGERSKFEPFRFRTVRVDDDDLITQLEEAGVEFTGTQPGGGSLIPILLMPIGLVVLAWFLLSRLLRRTGQTMMNVGKSKAKVYAEKETGITFNDVAGCDEAKEDLSEVVQFLKSPDRFTDLGAKIPKGVLLVGPPGTGKTLLAKAIAGEAEVPFLFISGSDFVEMFVGVGASRVRDLFAQAVRQAPCIVFIDEIDAIGRERGVHLGVANDEREQTLNQLLVEMDGFETNNGVILLAATNRPEVLDRALLRPGRFDRQILVDAPDIDGREAILNVHARDKRLAADANLKTVAQSSPGFSGADLANVMNEAALLAARRQASAIGHADLEAAVERVVAGPERRSRRLDEDERVRVAYHEVGHALVAAYSEHADPVHKISIIPRGRAALGYTMQLPTEQQFLLTKAELLDRLRGLLGGRAAEELVFADVSTGAENDLERATALARQMVCLYGMSDAIGLMHCGQRQGQFLPDPRASLQKSCSDDTEREIDTEVKKILAAAYSDARKILDDHRGKLEAVAKHLIQHETVDRGAFEALLRKLEKPGEDIAGVNSTDAMHRCPILSLKFDRVLVAFNAAVGLAVERCNPQLSWHLVGPVVPPPACDPDYLSHARRADSLDNALHLAVAIA